ncbi:MAG: hypothetical protein O7H41_21625 [Planctomycetota bacterium]|nr:hypothetical protein [Planctomycetota bacterium]
MRYWAVDDRHYDPLHNRVKLSSWRRVSILPPDRIVLFQRDTGDVSFIGTTAVLSASSEEQPEERPLHTFETEELESFDTPRDLESIAYSLTLIKRFDRPHLHFSRAYRLLGKNNFSVIQRGSIFWARTAFGRYVNALHPDQIRNFVQFIAQTEPELLVRPSPFSLAWQALRTFLRYEYVGATELLHAIRDIAERIQGSLGGDFSYSALQISSSDESRNDSLAVQEARLSRFVDSLASDQDAPNLLERIDERISDSFESEKVFEAEFEGTRWPMLKTSGLFAQ